MFLICVESRILLQTDEPTHALVSLRAARDDGHPGAFLAEVVIPASDGKLPIPGELDRAITEWNALTKRVHLRAIRNRSLYVAPYRAWIKKAGQRDYLLENLVADVEQTRFVWPWIHFGWFFGKDNGMLNSEKLHGGQWKALQPIGAKQRQPTADEIAGFPTER
jgi:hypothetical protein